MSSAVHDRSVDPGEVLSRTARVTRGLPMGVVIAAGDVTALLVMLAVVDWAPLLWLYALLVLGVQLTAGAYRFQIDPSGLRYVPRVLGRVAVPLMIVGALDLVSGTSGTVIEAGAVTGVCIVAGRVATAGVVRALRRRDRLTERTVILGSGVVARELADRLLQHEELGLRVVGYLDEGDNPVEMPVARLGTTADLERALVETRARHVLASFSHAREGDLVDVLRTIRDQDIDVHVVPRFFELGLGSGNHHSEDIWGIPVHRLPPPGTRAIGRHLKRAFDFTVSAVVLLLAAPALAIIALGVKLSSPGPIIFRQVRLGQHGREFELLKFRTMRVNADSDTTWNVAEDDRVTTIGRFLRDKSLDELPQFYNVLRGDMSLVGPRPERRHFADEFAQQVDHYEHRHRVPVGITGWSQVNGLRGDTSITERAQFDNSYIENWSLWQDITILARTLGVVIRGQS